MINFDVFLNKENKVCFIGIVDEKGCSYRRLWRTPIASNMTVEGRWVNTGGKIARFEAKNENDVERAVGNLKFVVEVDPDNYTFQARE